MKRNYCFKLAVLVLLTLCTFSAAAATAKASKRPHDLTQKLIRTGTNTLSRELGAGLKAPKVLSSSSAIVSGPSAELGDINFDVSGGKSIAKSAPMRITPTAPLRACVTYDIDKQSYGMVNVTASGLEVLRDHEGLDAGWGGTGVGSRYYFNTCAEVVNGYVNSVEAYLWDTSNWTCIGYDQDPSYNIMAYSMTCDPVTEVVYGCFFSSDLQTLEIGTLDPMTMKRTGTIATTTVPLYAMGFSSDGTLYGISRDGTLYTVSTTDGHYTKVASTGITTTYNTTGTIDSFNDVFYYAACPSGPSDNPSQDWALYSIDLRNGYKVEKCWNLRAELGGMYIANAAAKNEAPAAPSLTSVDFTEGQLEGTVSFTAPTATFSGAELSGALSYGIIANDKVVATGKTSAGATENVKITVPSAGLYTIKVYVSNETGNSPKSESITHWLGQGQPTAPANLAAAYTYGDSSVTVTWDSVKTALSDGYFDASKVSYTLSRSIDGAAWEVVANAITDTAFVDVVDSDAACRIYQYALVANHSGQVSDSVKTEYKAIGAIVPAFSPDYTKKLVEGYFTPKEYVKRGFAWSQSEYYGAMEYYGNAYYNSKVDAALITVPVKLEGGKSYEISYDAINETSSAYGIGLQWGDNVDSLTTVIEPVTMQSKITHYSTLVSPETDGVYYFSVRVLSNSARSALVLVGNFKISKGLSVKAPSHVTDVVTTPPANGALKLDVSFTAPSTTIEGKNLTDLTKIEVTRNGELVYTFRNPTFGQKLSFTDSGTKNEDVTYVFTPYNSKGQGLTYSVAAHMGVNLPAAPVNCQIVQDMSDPGVVTITWTPVAKDIDGNNINSNLIHYAIFASDYNTLIDNGIPASVATTKFRAINADAGQAFVYYFVVPYTEGGVNGYSGGYGVTPMIPVGTPYEMPYMESFTSNSMKYAMAQSGAQMRIASGISSSQLTIGAQDSDNGILALYTAPGNYTDLYSANVKVDNNDDVAMSFYYTGVPEVEGYAILPYVICDGKKEALSDTIFSRNCDEKGWNRVQLSLAKYKGKTIQFGYYVYCIMNNFAFGLDNIVVKRFVANDLRAGSVSGPSKLKQGKDNDIILEVANDGSDDAPANYRVELYADGEVVNTAEGVAVEAYSTGAVTFNHMPSPFAKEQETLYAIIRWDDDQATYNNVSDTISIPIVESEYPAVTDLSAKLTEDNKAIDVKWSEPDHAPKMKEITDSFEDYDPFTIAGFGDWKVKDYDGQNTYYFGGSVWEPGVGNVASYPNGTTPKAWFVLDKNQIKRLYYDVSRTGDRAIAAVSTKEVANDWLFSPELSGTAQTVTFYAATAPEDYGKESFRFYYSLSDGTDTTTYVQMGEEVEVPEGKWIENEDGDEEQVTTWYQYSYQLPAGAKHFAIRYVSEDIFAMLIDDITYTVSEESLTLLGYNLYRNGEQLNDSLLTITALRDTLDKLDPGQYSYSYAVETVYDKGHSGLSNIDTVDLEVSGVNDVNAAAIEVVGQKGYIVVKGAAGLAVEVFNTAGVKVYGSDNADDVTRIAADQGVYIVKAGATVAKVIVR